MAATSDAPREVSGPSGAELARALLLRRADAIAFFRELIDRYGSVVRFVVGRTNVFVVADAAWVRHVYVDRAKNYGKGPVTERLEPVMGRGLITSDGELWRTQRRLAQPAFSKERLASLTVAMIEESEAHAASWKAPCEVDAAEDMMHLALRVVARTLLGADLAAKEAQVSEALADIVGGLEARAVSPARILELVPRLRKSKTVRRAIDGLPTRANRKLTRAIETLDAIVYGVIRERRATVARGGEVPDDLLTRLLRATDDAGGSMSDTQLRDEVMTLFLAGHETVATGLAWALFEIARNEDVQDRVRREIETVTKGRAMNADDVASLPYLRAVVDESLRLYPPVWRLSRRSIEDDVIAGCAVPAGSFMVTLPFFVQRSASYWGENPDAFVPDRWLSGREAPRGAYFPFGIGARACIGTSFAVVESMAVIAAIVRRHRIALAGDREPKFLPRITLRPRGPIRLRVSAVAP